MKKTRIGVQIGENFFRIIVAERQGKRWEKTFEEVEPLPEGIVKGGQILEPERLGLIIKELFLKKNIRETHVSVFVEEAPFFIRHVEMPRLNKKELASAIELRAQTELPVNPGDLVMRYYPYEARKNGEEAQDEYIIVAVDKGLINTTADVFHNAGLTISSISLEPVALYHGLLLNPEYANQLKNNILLVRTDTKRLMISIFSYGRLIYSRYLPFSTGKADWEQEISRTYVSWNSGEGHARVEQVVLFGEKEHGEEARKHLQEIIPFSVLLVTGPTLPCEGIALKKPEELNFFADKVTFNLLKKTPLYVYALVIVTGFMLLSLLYQYGSQAIVRAQISSYQSGINQHKNIQTLLNKQKELTALRSDVMKLESQIRSQNIDPIANYNLVAPKTPGSITFSQIVFDNQGIKVTGRTTDQQTLFAYYLNLQNNPSLSDVKLDNSTSGIGGVQFVITMTRKAGGGK